MCAIRRILRIFLPQYIYPSIYPIHQNRTFLSVERHFFLLTILAYIFSQNSIYLLTILAYIFSQNSMTYIIILQKGCQDHKLKKLERC